LKDYDLPRVLGREVDLAVATTRLIAGGIFDRFPNLKIVITTLVQYSFLKTSDWSKLV
jgi:predicted TIM-barrel fold metal-dependent hydrolase